MANKVTFLDFRGVDRPPWVSKYTYAGFFSTQYETTRLARIRLCWLMGIRLNRCGSDIWV